MTSHSQKNNITDLRFRALMAKAHEGIVLYDSTGVIIYASPSSKNVGGYEETELLGKSGADFVHPDEIEETRQNFGLVMQKAGTSITYRHRLLHKAGHYFWAETTLSNYLHEPEVGGIISNFRDINIQKEAEDKALESKFLLESINQNIKEGIYRNVPDKSFEYVNQAFLDMFRFDSLEDLNRVTSSSLYVDPDVRIMIKELLLNEKAINNIEAEFRRKDGSTFWGLISSTFIIGPNGQKYFDGAIRDITNQKVAEEKLKRSEEFLTSINRNIKEGLYRSSVDQGMIYVNEAFAEIFGYPSAKEILSVDISALYFKPGIRRQIIKDLHLHGAIRNLEVQFKRKDGSMFWGLMSSYLMKSISGEEYFDGAVRDITELKQAEDELLKLNDTLKSKNQALEQREEELNKALNELSDRNFELDQLVYKTSHDLRSPLSSILGLVHVAKLDTDSPDKTHYIERIGASIQRLDEFVRSMLNYAKASRVEVQFEEVDLQDMIERCIKDLEFLDSFDRVEVGLNLKIGRPIKTDKLKLKIILSNIISNAYKYMDSFKANPYLKIDAWLEKSMLKLILKDNGVGIEPEHLPRIFDMFYRGTELSQGSGLGMYIVKQSIDKLDGKITIDSVFGEGSTFTISIPLPA